MKPTYYAGHESLEELERQMLWHNHQDSTFRLVVFVYAIAISLLAFAHFKDFLEIVIVASILIVLALAYATYVTVRVTRELRGVESYSIVNNIFYFMMILLFFIIFLLVGLRLGSDMTGIAKPLVG